jgi:hypothetical protein
MSPRPALTRDGAIIMGPPGATPTDHVILRAGARSEIVARDRLPSELRRLSSGIDAEAVREGVERVERDADPAPDGSAGGFTCVTLGDEGRVFVETIDLFCIGPIPLPSKGGAA